MQKNCGMVPNGLAVWAERAAVPARQVVSGRLLFDAPSAIDEDLWTRIIRGIDVNDPDSLKHSGNWYPLHWQTTDVHVLEAISCLPDGDKRSDTGIQRRLRFIKFIADPLEVGRVYSSASPLLELSLAPLAKQWQI
jgi:hypothetical protein